MEAKKIDDSVLQLSYQIQKVQMLPRIRETLQKKIGKIQQHIISVESDLGKADIAKTFYQKAIDVMYDESKGELERAITSALQYVFYDKKYLCEVLLGDQRGKTLTFLIKDETSGDTIEVDLKEGTGRGIRSVVSFVSQVYFLLSRGFPFLFVDEAYTGLSDKYVERFFTFARVFSEKRGLIFVLITHDPRFMDYGDRTYRVVDGIIEELGVEGGLEDV